MSNDLNECFNSIYENGSTIEGINGLQTLCELCDNVLSEPVMLSCLHVFDKNCLLAMESHRINISQMRCPKCDIASSLSNLKSLKNYNSTAQVDVQSDTDSTNFNCDFNKCILCTTGEVGVYKCPECAGIICERCCNLHKEVVIFQSHCNVEELSEKDKKNIRETVKYLYDNKPIKCPIHKEENLESFCLVCYVAMCGKCSNSSDHKGHESNPLSCLMSAMEPQLDTLVRRCRSSQTQICQRSERLSGSLADVAKSRDCNKAQIEEAVQMWRATIEQIKDDMLSANKSMHDGLEYKIMSQINEDQKQSEHIEYALEFVNGYVKTCPVIEASRLLKTSIECLETLSSYIGASNGGGGGGSNGSNDSSNGHLTLEELASGIGTASTTTTANTSSSASTSGLLMCNSGSGAGMLMTTRIPLHMPSCEDIRAVVRANFGNFASMMDPVSHHHHQQQQQQHTLIHQLQQQQHLPGMLTLSPGGGGGDPGDIFSPGYGEDPELLAHLHHSSAGLSNNLSHNSFPATMDGLAMTPGQAVLQQQHISANADFFSYSTQHSNSSNHQHQHQHSPILSGSKASLPGSSNDGNVPPTSSSSQFLPSGFYDESSLGSPILPPPPSVGSSRMLMGGGSGGQDPSNEFMLEQHNQQRHHQQQQHQQQQAASLMNLNPVPKPPFPRNRNYNPMVIKERWGCQGSTRGQLNSPHGFCLGFSEEIVVADTQNHRIQIFSKDGQFLSQFGIAGREEGHLWHPRKVTIIRNSQHYVVCDRGSERSRMQIFAKNGYFIRKIAIPYIDIVAGLAINNQGHIVAVDSVSPTIFVVTENGEMVKWIECSSQMREPSDIVVHGDNYYICDFKGHCVCVYKQDGTFLFRFGNEKITNYPNGIDVSNLGDILVGDSHGNRFHVAVFTKEGHLTGEFECPSVKVSRACGLKITSEGYLVTLAKNNHNVLVIDTLYVN